MSDAYANVMIVMYISDHNKAFADDSRFSKFVKRLMREDDRDKRLTAGKQLRDFLLLPENAKVRSPDQMHKFSLRRFHCSISYILGPFNKGY